MLWCEVGTMVGHKETEDLMELTFWRNRGRQ